MAFEILLHPRAAKELQKLEETLRTRIKERLRELKENPESRGKALKPSDFFTLRIGDYRVIFEIDRAKKQVVVLFIGHRKKVYDDPQKCSDHDLLPRRSVSACSMNLLHQNKKCDECASYIRADGLTR